MTREEASTILYKEWQRFLEDNLDYAGISDAYTMAINTLKQEPCGDAISRKVVLNKIKEVCFSREKEWIDFRVSQGSNGQRDFIIKFIESLPPVTPKPKTGHWNTYELAQGGINEKWLECSECMWSNALLIPRNYCPKCGARMMEKEDDKE